MPDKRKHYGKPLPGNYWIYFIRAGDDGPIKIGRSNGPLRSRIRALQTANAHKLKVLAAIQADLMLDHSLEEWIHEALSDHRMQGEWFTPCQRVLAYALLAHAGLLDPIRTLVKSEYYDAIQSGSMLSICDQIEERRASP